MSKYLNDFVGYVWKYFRKDNRPPRSEKTLPPRSENTLPSRRENVLSYDTPPRNHRNWQVSKKNNSSPIKREIWFTPKANLRRENSCPPRISDLRSRPFGITPLDPARFYGCGDGDNWNNPDRLLDQNWNLLRRYSSDSQHSLGFLRNSKKRTVFSPSAKQCRSLDIRPSTPMFNMSRDVEWKKNYDKFLARPYPSEEDQSKRFRSKIPIFSGKCASLEDTRLMRSRSAGRCTCRRFNLDRLCDPIVTRLRFEEERTARCNKALIAQRSQLNVKLERMFRNVSKKKYCGNIIDTSSHVRWMKLAGVEEDYDGSNFKKFAKGRVVLTVSEYKSALKKMSEDYSLDYWDVLQRMTDIPLTSCDANSSASSCRDDH